MQSETLAYGLAGVPTFAFGDQMRRLRATLGRVSDLVFFDRRGAAIAYKDEGDDVIFTWEGRPSAIVADEAVYFFDGRHAGWFVDGWIRDHRGGVVYFTDGAQGGPARPARQARRARGARQTRPTRGARQARPARPARQMAWSPLSDGTAFFTRASR